jgi:hypothetical protein
MQTQFHKKRNNYLTISQDSFKKDCLMAKPVVKQGRKTTGLMIDSRVPTASIFCMFSRVLTFHEYPAFFMIIVLKIN